jgi:hypothetical protein
MNTYSRKDQAPKSQSLGGAITGKQNRGLGNFPLNNNRPAAIAQRKLQAIANSSLQTRQLKTIQRVATTGIQANQVVQRVLSDAEVIEWASLSEEDCSYLEEDEKEQIKDYKATRARQDKQNTDWTAALASRVVAKSCVSWEYGGKTYHINLGLGEYHVTEEASPKIHYFFKGLGKDITNKTSGNGGKHDKMFSALPSAVQTFIKSNFSELLV